MDGKMRNWLTPLVLAALLVLAAGPGQAEPLSPGNTITNIDNIGLGGNFSILKRTSSFFTTSGGVSGFVVESVIKGDTNNASGGLDFVYELVNTSGSGSLSSLSSLSFEGFSTDVSQVQLGGTTVGASSVSRTASGDTVTWQFISSGQGTMTPGDVSDNLIVRTNASQYITGSITIADGDGGTSSVNGFATTNLATVPEPSSLVLLGSGLVGLGGAVFRRRHQMEPRRTKGTKRTPRAFVSGGSFA